MWWWALHSLPEKAAVGLGKNNIWALLCIFQRGSLMADYAGALIVTSLVAQLVKNPPAMQETWILSLDWKIPWRRERLPTPVFWPGEFHGLYSPWNHRVRYNWLTFTSLIVMQPSNRAGECDGILIVFQKTYDIGITGYTTNDLMIYTKQVGQHIFISSNLNTSQGFVQVSGS